MNRVIAAVYIGKPNACTNDSEDAYKYSTALLEAVKSDAMREYVSRRVDDETIARVIALIESHPHEAFTGDHNVSLEHEGSIYTMYWLHDDQTAQTAEQCLQSGARQSSMKEPIRMIIPHEKGNPGSFVAQCYDCGNDWTQKDIDEDPRLAVGQRCPVPECDSNHQFACNEAAAAATGLDSDAICRCAGVRGGMTRNEKSPLSDTGLDEIEQRRARTRLRLVNDIVKTTNGHITDARAIDEIRALLGEFERESAGWS